MHFAVDIEGIAVGVGGMVVDIEGIAADADSGVV